MQRVPAWGTGEEGGKELSLTQLLTNSYFQLNGKMKHCCNALCYSKEIALMDL